MQWRGVRRLSVCLSVNFWANRFFSQTNGRIATKLAHDGFQVRVHPGCAQGQGQGQTSRDTRTFWILGMSYSGLVHVFIAAAVMVGLHLVAVLGVAIHCGMLKKSVPERIVTQRLCDRRSSAVRKCTDVMPGRAPINLALTPADRVPVVRRRPCLVDAAA